MTIHNLRERLKNISDGIPVDSRLSYENMRDEVIKVVVTYLKYTLRKDVILVENDPEFLVKIGSILGEIISSEEWIDEFCDVLEEELNKQ